MKRIYLDYNATTPVDARVLEKMNPYFLTEFGNASSQHTHGWVGQKAVEKARAQISKLLGASESKDIIFTSGASEANTLAIYGLAKKLIEKKNTKKDFQQISAKKNSEQNTLANSFNISEGQIHFITSQAEHHSVLESMRAAEQLGVEVTYLPVNKYGQVEIKNILRALRPHTVLLSFMWANNEVGSLNPIEKIAELATENQLIFHTDATPACGKIPIDLTKIKIDMLSLSAHKFYGPKGIGALYVHKNLIEAESLAPIIFGGTHERGLRAGTLNVPGIVGLGEASEIALKEMETEAQRLNEFRQKVWLELKSFYPKLEWNGHPSERVPGQMNFLFRDKRIDQILPRMVNLSMSSGSACASNSISVSHVLQSIGLSREEILGSVRLSFGRPTSIEEVEETCRILKEHL